MNYRNYVEVVDEIMRHAYSEAQDFTIEKKEAEDLCEYLERRVEEFCKSVRDGFSK